MNTAKSSGDSLFNTFVELAGESVMDVASAIGDGAKEIADLASTPAQPMPEGEYFAHAVDDPKAYPPKDEAMAEMVEDRRSSERVEDNLRAADGGCPELSEQDKRERMQDRMQCYLTSQMHLSL